MEFEYILQLEKAKEVNGKKEVVPYEAPAISRGFDTRAVMADLKALELKCKDLINEANALEITTAAEKLDATNLSGGLQELVKQVKKKCEDFLEPHKKVTSAINGPKKRITEAATTAKNIVNQKIIQYGKQEEINQARQQKIIDEQTAQLQEKLKVQAKELKIEAPKVAPIQAPKPVTIVRGDSGASVYTRKGWKCEIVDPDKVPFALKGKDGKEKFRLCIPSMKLLNQAFKMGVREIPGCRIYEDETPVTRTG